MIDLKWLRTRIQESRDRAADREAGALLAADEADEKGDTDVAMGCHRQSNYWYGYGAAMEQVGVWIAEETGGAS